MIGKSIVTPVGPAVISGVSPDGTMVLVRYSRKDYQPSDWLRLSPSNGPCIYRFEPLVNVRMSMVGSTWVNSKSGKRYTILAVSGTKVKIQSLDTSLTWWTTLESLEKRFRKEGF